MPLECTPLKDFFELAPRTIDVFGTALWDS